ncbi:MULTISPECIES: zinc-binding dehydrogenase [unclassified Mycolicibacterium]|uniref:quinone oxidoreductase family protein n=1 Tax=unclassified Mycolicibacterium TaxID=2636767 RepID=UPI00192E3DE1|nr:MULTISPECIES: zinc-binding dehydrogenase [unclassified Mycolicibacterium]
MAELADPTPGPGQITIDVTHSAVGLIDAYLRRGQFKNMKNLPQPPYVPGAEMVGRVRALGEGVTGFDIGEQVATLTVGGVGGYSSVATADARFVVSIDGSDLDPGLVVSTLGNAVTAQIGLAHITHLTAGESVLVHGALGGLASAFVGMARALGAGRIVGTVRSSSMAQAASSKLPFDQVVSAEEFPARLRDEKFDVAVDAVGGPLRDATWEVMAPLGRVLVVGNASDDWSSQVDPNALWTRSISVAGFSVGLILPVHPEFAAPAARLALQAIKDGLLDVPVEELPLSRAAEAHRRLEYGPVTGRVVLISEDKR